MAEPWNWKLTVEPEVLLSWYGAKFRTWWSVEVNQSPEYCKTEVLVLSTTSVAGASRLYKIPGKKLGRRLGVVIKCLPGSKRLGDDSVIKYHLGIGRSALK